MYIVPTSRANSEKLVMRSINDDNTVSDSLCTWSDEGLWKQTQGMEAAYKGQQFFPKVRLK